MKVKIRILEIPSESNRVLRGGSWCNDPAAARVADRDWFTPGHRWSSLGFRLILVLK